MKTTTLKIFPLLAALGVACISPATAAVSDTVGYNTITCLANSDTIVGVPLRQSGSIKGSLNGVPDTSTPGFATLTLSAAPSETGLDEFSYYLQFTSGTKNGQYFTIGVNGGTSVTIDLNGGNLDGVVGVTTTEPVATADTFIIAKYWTLNDLFPPAGATTSWDAEGNPNGHAIVASLGDLGFQRRTVLLMPDLDSEGINQAPNKIFYIAGNEWKTALGPANAGILPLMPDSQLIIRHPASVTLTTNYTCIGEVSSEIIDIPLATSANSGQDNRVGIPRPIDIKLSELELISSGAFIGSANTLGFNRRDILFVYDNTSPGINKSASDTYYFDNSTSAWRNSGGQISNDVVIPAGSGLTIRKFKADGNNVQWTNSPSY